MWENIIVGWAIFIIAVYAWMWYDDAYYSYNLSGKFKQVKDTLTEE